MRWLAKIVARFVEEVQSELRFIQAERLAKTPVWQSESYGKIGVAREIRDILAETEGSTATRFSAPPLARGDEAVAPVPPASEPPDVVPQRGLPQGEGWQLWRVTPPSGGGGLIDIETEFGRASDVDPSDLTTWFDTSGVWWRASSYRRQEEKREAE